MPYAQSLAQRKLKNFLPDILNQLRILIVYHPTPIIYIIKRMNKSLVILGRQPLLGIAELESLYGAAKIHPFGDKFALLDIDAKDVQFNRLGGIIKLASIVAELPGTDWAVVEKYLLKMTTEHLSFIPEEGKFNIGISAYGLKANTKTITSTALSIKKIVKASGRSVRIVPNKSSALSTPQVLHNHLVGAERGWEIVCIRQKNKTLIGLTMGEQDIDAYTARDQARPRRDAFVGMLPPKLAQIIINLAVGQVTHNDKVQPTTILDPFCGTGVVLQEALLMGYNVLGTDIEPRMVEYSTDNIKWLKDRWHRAIGNSRIEVGDACSHRWSLPVNTVAAETYLGRPLSNIPNPDVLQEIISPVNMIHKKFLQNLSKQLKSGTRICIAVPAWQIKHNQFKHLPFLGQLEQLGYKRIKLSLVTNDNLLYYREDQIVARELLILVKS